MIKVKFLDGNEINIGIEKTTIVNEIIKCIAKHLKLKSYLDFKLYFLLIFILFRLFIIESDNEYCSLLDDEEPIG